ncbi:MAG: nitroreductase family deazaflavin-dependent oxidoreductase [Streptosporangiaceae bacterium]|nr:nitroreductase family deazaflavin-dependent oxidoreductase [Streptosporangiaceae bacterium]
MSDTAHDDWNASVISEFRANGGKVGGSLEGSDLLLLHHNGAKTGTERINPLAYQKVGNGYAVFASFGGHPRDPQWFRNLLANPDATVEIGTDTVRVRARVADPEERETIWARQKATRPIFAGYEVKANPRQIPVVVLEPVA